MKEYNVTVLLADGRTVVQNMEGGSPEIAANHVLRTLGFKDGAKKLTLGAVCTVMVQSGSQGRTSYYTYDAAGVVQNQGRRKVSNFYLTNPSNVPFALSNITADVFNFKYAVLKAGDVAGIVSAVNRNKFDYISPFRLDVQEDNAIRLKSKDKLGNIQYLIISYE